MELLITDLLNSRKIGEITNTHLIFLILFRLRCVNIPWKPTDTWPRDRCGRAQLVLLPSLAWFDFILEKPATRPRDRCGKEQLVYPFATGFPGSSRVSALAPYSSGDRVGSTLSTPHAGGDLGMGSPFDFDFIQILIFFLFYSVETDRYLASRPVR